MSRSASSSMRRGGASMKRNLPPRPDSGSIRIRDVPTKANPVPIMTARSIDDETEASLEELFLEDTLTENRLRSMSGKRNLEKVDYLELHDIDTAVTSLAELGSMLPNLKRLKLRDCALESFRDFGTQLQSLKVLWMPRCGINELDGIAALGGLEELYIAFNDVNDLAPLALHENLQILDLESNNVEDLGQVEQLGTCPKLHSLTLEANPLARVKHYRRVICSQIPQLKNLDDRPISKAERKRVDIGKLRKLMQRHSKKKSAVDEAADELRMITEAIKCRTVNRIDDAGQLSPVGRRRMGLRARSAGMLGTGNRFRTKIPRRPASGSDTSSLSQQLINYKNMSKDSGKQSSMLKLLQDVGIQETSSTSGSDLTMGTSITFAGNPVIAMRRRRKESQQPAKQSTLITDTLDYGQSLEGKSIEEVKADFKNWNLEEAVAKLRKDANRRKALMMARPGTAAAPKVASFIAKDSKKRKITVSTDKTAEVLKIHDDSDTEDHSPVSAALAAAADPVVETPKKNKRNKTVMMRPSTAMPSSTRGPISIQPMLVSEEAGTASNSVQNKSSSAPKSKVRSKQLSISNLDSVQEEIEEQNIGQSTEDIEEVLQIEISRAKNQPSSIIGPGSISRSPTSNSMNSSLNNSFVPSVRVKTESEQKTRNAKAMEDALLISMLKEKPRNVPELQTRANFRDFFFEFPETRMRRLLRQAYKHKKDCDKRTEKRLKLLEGVLDKSR